MELAKTIPSDDEILFGCCQNIETEGQFAKVIIFGVD
jgi:hypothetical protein